MATANERMARTRARRTAAGLHQILLWVPKGEAENVRRVVREYLERRSAAPSSQPGPEPFNPLLNLPPEPARTEPDPPLDELTAPYRIAFDGKPKFEMRERLKRLGFAFDTQQQAWIGRVKIGTARQIRADIVRAGGSINVVGGGGA